MGGDTEQISDFLDWAGLRSDLAGSLGSLGAIPRRPRSIRCSDSAVQSSVCSRDHFRPPVGARSLANPLRIRYECLRGAGRNIVDLIGYSWRRVTPLWVPLGGAIFALAPELPETTRHSPSGQQSADALVACCILIRRRRGGSLCVFTHSFPT